MYIFRYFYQLLNNIRSYLLWSPVIIVRSRIYGDFDAVQRELNVNTTK